ncbi:hypothetical protein, partial [Salmonella sp. s51933]|uniref:hypothetical protein n=1 Tax=Salmonella sp. s51933 TaxID=3160127 RepID=UPI0037551245
RNCYTCGEPGEVVVEEEEEEVVVVENVSTVERLDIFQEIVLVKVQEILEIAIIVEKLAT